jgi:hypothetical protein
MLSLIFPRGEGELIHIVDNLLALLMGLSLPPEL